MAVPTPNSSTGGYLTPTSAAPPFDDALDDIFHDVLQGVLGMTDATLVRPRFQPEPPDEPEPGVDWVAFGITDSKKDWNPYQGFDPLAFDGLGAIVTQQDEEFTLSLSYFGPNARAAQSLFEDGIKLDQNREALEALGIKFMGHYDAYRLPALLKQLWVNRIDQKFTFRRRVVRQYAVLTIASASVKYLDNEHYLTEIDVTPTP